MKVLIRVLLLILVVTGLSGCKSAVKPADSQQPNSKIVGSWVYQGHNALNGNLQYQKANQLVVNRSGFSIHPNGTLEEYCVAGNSGILPPYKAFRGKWRQVSENILQISYTHYDGSRSYKLNIVSVDAGKMECRKTIYRNTRRQVW